MRDVRPGAKATSGGSSDSELNDWQVKPTGPSAVTAVTTVTPDAKWPSTSRMTCGSTIRGTSGDAGHARAAAERGTERPPARYSELGSSWPTACSVTRAAASTASRSSPVRTPDSSSM